MNKVTEKEFTHFLEDLARLNPIEFLGVATLVKVPCFEDFERKKPRPTEEIMSDLMDKFLALPPSKRKYLMRQMKQTAKTRR